MSKAITLWSTSLMDRLKEGMKSHSDIEFHINLMDKLFHFYDIVKKDNLHIVITEEDDHHHHQIEDSEDSQIEDLDEDEDEEGEIAGEDEELLDDNAGTDSENISLDDI